MELYLGETANLTCETDVPIQFLPGWSWTQNNDLLINNGSEIIISKANLKNSRVYECTDHSPFYFNNIKTVTFHVTVRNETCKLVISVACISFTGFTHIVHVR